MKPLYFLALLVCCGYASAFSQNMMTINFTDNSSNSYSLDSIAQVRFESVDIPVESVEITSGDMTLDIGDTITLGYQYAPENASNPSFTWQSSNPQVATISDMGMVTAIAEGTATITLSTTSGEVSDQISITVQDPSSVQENFANSIRIFPNPVKDRLLVELDGIHRYELIISDTRGNVIYSQYDQPEIGLSSLASGVYFLTIAADGNYFNQQIIKE